jgi:hypothetical protein
MEISIKKIVSFIILFICTLFWRSPDLVLYPRFWAEEGIYYYSLLQGESFLNTLSLIVRGNFQLLTNWILYFSTLVPAKYAAYVSTYLSLFVASVFIGLVGLLSVQREWTPSLSAVVIIILALLPQGYEIYLTATNVQWILSVCVVMILILETKDWSNINKTCAYILVVISGLTGVCSVMLTPIFFLRGFLLSSRFYLRSGLILAFCTLLHAMIILQNSHEGRSFPTDMYTLTFPLIIQSIWSPIIGAKGVDDALILIKNFQPNWILVGFIYLISVLVALFAVLTASKGMRDQYLVLMIFIAWVYISVLNIIGSIGDPNSLVSGWGGGRYFYLGSVCFILLLAFSASNSKSRYYKIAYLILLVTMISSINQVINGDWKNWLISGQSWYETVNRCMELRPCKVEVWPGGPDWTFNLSRP